MGIKEDAIELHTSGRNCAQCVLMTCRSFTGLDNITAESVAAAFGGGMRCGEVCGAITGGLMAIGLTKYENTESRSAINSLTTIYIGAFREKYGTVLCRELKKEKISCDELIGFGAETAEKLLNNN